MSNNKICVSVVMNCYNGEKYLRGAIESVLAQTYQNWELILWDNKSTDNSAKIAQLYDDHRIVYCMSKSHTSLGEARNLAIKQSKGDLIAFLDCDDLWFPEKIAKQIPLFNDPKVGLVICDTIFFNEKGIQRQLYKKQKPPKGNVFRELLGGYFISLETAVIRRKALDSIENWFDNRFELIEEYDLFARISYRWHLDYVDEVLAKWRVHSSSWTWNRKEFFPKERKLMLSKLRCLIPEFEKSYKKEIIQIERICSMEEAQIAWKEDRNLEARQILNPHKTKGLKWFAVYCMTWFPYHWFEKLQKWSGSVLPI